ncbi:hypothetical protein ABDK75_16110 [Gluconobacter sp. OJA]|uniref:hypothetical protein n=1 Tax=Gluconobacter sp. OJA TaxID=3145197 RepID=UPI0031F9AF02
MTAMSYRVAMVSGIVGISLILAGYARVKYLRSNPSPSGLSSAAVERVLLIVFYGSLVNIAVALLTL